MVIQVPTSLYRYILPHGEGVACPLWVDVAFPLDVSPRTERSICDWETYVSH